MLGILPQQAVENDVARLDLEVAVACLRYVRDIVLISRGDGDLIETIVFTAALDANMAPVDRDPDLGVIYGGAEASAPDELRRPVSINAVAQSLGLPFETVRRRFVDLVRHGACVAVPGGLIVPRSAVTSDAYMAIQQARFERTQALYVTLRGLGAIELLTEVRDSSAEPLVRAANRAVSEYMLRVCPALVGLTQNVLTTLVFMQLVLDNIEEMDGAGLETWAIEHGAVGRPVRMAVVAGRLPLSRETVRRHVRTLEDLGFCRRVEGGFVAVAPPWAVPEISRLAAANRIDLRRLLARLYRLGVLSAWDVA
ncbi:hypothetical protein [Caulobacter sp. NIBR2454]|uniref:hypothetical protein n=1 Tax=Caulobacter sp. NIBR2454 TaxID=3015996 RepID=UPI0022B5FFF9|nr:hypothetical protein [Caulobacter sp. NIBR2454]